MAVSRIPPILVIASIDLEEEVVAAEEAAEDEATEEDRVEAEEVAAE